jgi:hypothetical protein
MIKCRKTQSASRRGALDNAARKLSTGYHRGQHSTEALLLCKAKPSRVPLPEPPGAGGAEVFTFQALRVGTTSITFDYVSSTGAVTQSTSYTVVVH